MRKKQTHYHAKIDLVGRRVSKKGLGDTVNGVLSCRGHMIPPSNGP